jgi:hypothetical protein
MRSRRCRAADRCSAGLCAGPIPEALVALWQETAGGRLDYDLALPMNGNIESVSWSELFWDGSDGYHDLQGWIEHEQALAADAAAENGAPWSGKLTHLPFGGFEYRTASTPWSSPARRTAGSSHGSRACRRPGRTRCTKTP